MSQNAWKKICTELGEKAAKQELARSQRSDFSVLLTGEITE